MTKNPHIEKHEHRPAVDASSEHRPATNQPVADRGKSVHRKAGGRHAKHDHDRAYQAPFSNANRVSGRGDADGMTGSAHKREKTPDELRRGGIAIDPKKPPRF
jgi:hypothetical protein